MSKSVSAVALLARRFLLSKASDGFLSFIAWVSILGVALGVLALVVVMSVINGFEGELVRVITGMHGDVVFYTRGDPISDPDEVGLRIRKTVPEVKTMTQSFVTELMASGPGGVAGAMLEGVDFATVGDVTEITDRVVAGRLPVEDGEVALGTSLADRLGVKQEACDGAAGCKDPEIRLIIPFTGETQAGQEPGSGSPKAVKARVVGFIKMGMHEYDSKFVYATLPSVQNFVGQPGRITMYKLRLAAGSDTRKASDKLADAFGYPYRAKDWAQLNKNLFYAIQLEKVVIA
ncbi:MAG TPA: ABC transporter permease, partial [Bdellovibrionota bacterium]|nr:ABC transporter permease [Bdellovibrionota bacterium]